MKALFAFLLALPTVTTAQTLFERVDAGRDIGLQEWQELTSGRTVVYQVFGINQGREFYPTSGNKIYYEFPDGACLEGFFSYENNSFCYDWADREKQCYFHKQVDDQYYIVGTDSQSVIFVSDIVDDPFTCQPDMLSMLETPMLWSSE